MDPDIDLIRNRSENLNMVGQREAYRVAYRPKHIEKMKLWDRSGSGLGVLGRPLEIRLRTC